MRRCVLGLLFWLGLFLLIVSPVLQQAGHLFPQWPEQDEQQWPAVEATATVVASLIAVIALAGLWLQLREQARQTRQNSSPIVRFDFSIDHVGMSWEPPRTSPQYQFDWADFNPDEEKPDSLLDSWADPDGMDICLWLRNLQTQPGGAAYNVVVLMDLVLPSPDDGTPVLEHHNLTLKYLEPHRTIRYRLGRIGTDVPAQGEIKAISYYDMHQKERQLSFGSYAFAWDGVYRARIYRRAFDDRGNLMGEG